MSTIGLLTVATLLFLSAKTPRAELRMYVDPQIGRVPFVVSAQGMKLLDPLREWVCPQFILDWGDDTGGTVYDATYEDRACDPYAFEQPDHWSMVGRNHWYRRPGSYEVRLMVKAQGKTMAKRVAVVAL
jgi:hypothetical protein